MQDQSYVFVPPASMQAGIEAGDFLEASEWNGLHGSGMFGVSYDGIRDVAATGTHHTQSNRLQQCLTCNIDFMQLLAALFKVKHIKHIVIAVPAVLYSSGSLLTSHLTFSQLCRVCRRLQGGPSRSAGIAEQTCSRCCVHPPQACINGGLGSCTESQASIGFQCVSNSKRQNGSMCPMTSKLSLRIVL